MQENQRINIYLIYMETNDDTLLNVQEIVRRAKEIRGFKTDLELAQFLGIARSTLSNWITRNSIDYPLILEKMKDVDYNWLLTGKGHPQQREQQMEGHQVEILHNSKTCDKIDDRFITLYDITAAANLKTLLTNRSQYILDSIRIPNVPQCDGAVYISGDSMYPILKSGDIIGFKEISSLDYIIYGEMYLVSFHIDGDDYLAVKYVNRSEKEGCIKLVSYNPHHDPMDLPLENIQAMGIVKFSIRKNMML
mgnify:CR=1 FL=1